VFFCLGVAAALHGWPLQTRESAPAVCSRCGWIPPATGHVLSVRNVRQLHEAVETATSGTTILVEDGEYQLEHALQLKVPNLTLRGKSGRPDRVILRGNGVQEERVGIAIGIGAPDITVADLTAGYVRHHGFQIQGERGASRATLHNVRVIDTGQQLVKGSVGRGGPYADDVLIGCSVFKYTDHAPSDYSNGVDVLAGGRWTVRDNRFERIRGPREKNWTAGPAILFWANSQDSIVERNVIVDSFRGIAFGLGPTSSTYHRESGFDHRGGIIRNNLVWNLNGWADEGIEANAATGLRIDHNTVYVESQALNWSISLRFPQTHALVRNNLSNQRIASRDGGHGELQGNIQNARRSWFVNPSVGDFHLVGQEVLPIDSGVTTHDAGADFDRAPRPKGRHPDAGAFEFGANPK
jgi:hypothetical protein